MKKLILLLLIVMSIGSCKKDKDKCSISPFQVNPFLEAGGVFTCGSNNYDYTYTCRKSSQIDSFSNCFFVNPVAFPVDETDMVYIMFGKMSYYRNDTFQTILYRDDCAKKLTYNVNMIQRDTTHWQFPGVMSVFCEVDSIPVDYQVEVNYKYVPLTP